MQGDLIEYRTLKRSDFKAAAPPAEAAEHAQRLGALTCTFIRTTPDTAYQIEEQREGTGPSTFVGRFVALGFVAYMDRSCSWWNPKPNAVSEDYILQHEQVHFALSELHARKRNHEARELLAEFSVRTSSLDAAKEEMKAKLNALVQEAIDDLLAENLDFDEDTSAEHDPEAQQGWWDKVHAEIKALD